MIAKSSRFLLPACIFLATLLVGCDSTDTSTAKTLKPVEVVWTQSITGEVTDSQDFTGRLNAVKTVEIKARVTGYIIEAPFKEGDLVTEKDVLFRIDPRSFESDYKQASANVKLSEAELLVHQKNAQRSQQLLASKSISNEDFDLSMATVDKNRASVAAMLATQERAKLYLDWTQVNAPITGRVSKRHVDPGNLITADSTILTTIVTEDPMFVYFDVDERTYLDLIQSAAPGVTASIATLQFPVLMRLANEETFTHTGNVNFIDNQVSSSTGTIRMRGVFQNPKGILKSGLFARIRLPIGTPYTAVMVPDEALMSDQGRKYLFVLNEKNEVVRTSVKTGQAVQELRVIKEGVKQGERVVVSGMQRVRPGLVVNGKMQAPPTRPASPLSRIFSPNQTAEAAEKKESARP